jgi:nitrogen fixation NifU-like protein
MNDTIYREIILEHYKNPHHFGKIDNPSHTSKGENPLCGDRLTIMLRSVDGVVEDVGFEGVGCAVSIAGMSMLADKLVGMSIEDTQKIDDKEILGALGLSADTSRAKCALLGLKTTQKLLEGYKL